MTTVTFTQTSGGSASVSISGKIVYGTDYYVKRLNHHILSIVDGSDKVYDAGPSKIYGTVLMKDISIDDRDDFLDWLQDDVILDTNKFTIGAIANINWGLGQNTAVTNCRYSGGNTTEDVFEFMPPGKYTLNFKYMAVIS